MQPDEIRPHELEHRRTIPLDVLYSRMQRNSNVPKLRNTPYFKRFTTADILAPYLLLPANPNRMGFRLCVGTFFGGEVGGYELRWTYNYPIRNNPLGGFDGFDISGPNIGAFFPNGSIPAIQQNGTVSVDDIFVTLNELNHIDPAKRFISVIGYESLLAVTSNKVAA